MEKDISLLVVEGNTAEMSALIRSLDGVPYGIFYADLLESLSQRISTTLVYPCEDGVNCLPEGKQLKNYDGVVWTGSTLNCYDNSDAVNNQLKLVPEVYNSGVPCFGSCWGMQIFTQEMGGSIRKNPKGREIGMARDITLKEAAEKHPMFRGRTKSYCSFAVHLDEVEKTAPNTTVLAGNEMSEVQALVIEDGDNSFWGVQYHPEFTFPAFAVVYRRQPEGLVKEKIFNSLEEVEAAAHAFDRLDEGSPDYQEEAEKLGLPKEVINPQQRRLEIINWLEQKVL